MSQTNVNIRMDSKLKKDFSSFCEEIGMSMTTAFCVFAKTAVREKRIPFEISLNEDPFYSESNLRYLKNKLDEYKSGKMQLVEHGLIED